LAKKKHLIVGIDPGTTVGVALLDLDGNLLAVHSSRTFTLKDIIQLVILEGYPLVVATDVSPVPTFVEKVCHLFEAVLYTPPRSLTLEEKREIARSFSATAKDEVVLKNSHERDALAAAAKALESYGEKFRWIDKKLEERDLVRFSEQVKSLVVSGSSLSASLGEVLSQKIEGGKIRQEPKAEGVEKAVAERRAKSRRIEESMIKNMQDEILELRTKLKERELKIRSLGLELENARSREFWKILRSKEVDSRNKMIMELRRSLARVAADRDRIRRKIAAMTDSDLWRVAERIETISVISNLSKRAIHDLKASGKERIRFVLAEDATGAGASASRSLSEMKVEAVFVGGHIPDEARRGLEALGILVIPRDRIDLVVSGDTALAEKGALEELIGRERRKLSQRIKRRATKGLVRLVEGYRKEISS